ncbi:MAG: NUDIX hydrolase [Pseudomonadota bacterium]
MTRARKSDPTSWLPAPQANPWTRRERREIYRNPWLTLVEDQVLTPAGTEGIYGVVAPRGLALGVVPVDPDNFTWLVGQYRYPLDRYSWEIPEGGGAPELDPVAEAARELKEETGLTAATWTHLMTLHTSNCFTSERAEIYLATDLKEGAPEPDETERLQLCRLPLTAACELARTGVITDAMSVAALLRLDSIAGAGEALALPGGLGK